MAFFNPNKIDFNYNSGYIEPVGAVGKSLWDIYKNESLASFNRAKLNETKRANEASENLQASKLALDEAQHNQTFAETARHNRVSETYYDNFLKFNQKKHADTLAYNDKLLKIKADEANAKLAQENMNNIVNAGAFSPIKWYNDNKDDKFMAAKFGALDPQSGEIDYSKFANNLSAFISKNKNWGEDLAKLQSAKENTSKDLAQKTQAFDSLIAAGEKLKQYGKPLDSYDGGIDRLGDFFATLSGSNEKNDVEAFIDTLNNAVVRSMMLSDKNQKEIDELKKRHDIKLDNLIFDNDTKAKAIKNTSLITDIAIAKLQTIYNATSDLGKKYVINEKIKQMKLGRDEMIKAINGKAKYIMKNDDMEDF